MIYVGNLPNTANETNLKECFDSFSGGEVRLISFCILWTGSLVHCLDTAWLGFDVQKCTTGAALCTFARVCERHFGFGLEPM